ncbi:MAG: class I SAM-dependent methyltransferase [Candidatus Rokubacteria bacterium]|nr:class I SAM-dependent methyltransferase [Candidatus Rokubacteria bacterium]
MSEAPTQARRVQQQFGAVAAAYVTSAGHAGGDDLDTLLAWGRALAPARVLDVATGAGHTALAFAGLGARVTAFDVTEPMLRTARDFLRGRGAGAVRFVAGDVEALPFCAGAFDVVTCRIAAHHFANVGPAVRQIAAALRAGGAFLVQDILGHDDPDAARFITEVERRRDPSHVRAYRAIEWKALLRGAGLTVMDEAQIRKDRPWDDWTRRTGMTAEARAALEDFVRAAPPACLEAFDFRIADGRVESFSDRMLLLRAERD